MRVILLAQSATIRIKVHLTAFPRSKLALSKEKTLCYKLYTQVI
jgi:hypothetical protein